MIQNYMPICFVLKFIGASLLIKKGLEKTRKITMIMMVVTVILVIANIILRIVFNTSRRQYYGWTIKSFMNENLSEFFNILLISISISKQNTCTFKVNINKVKIILIWRKADKRNNCGKFKIKKLLTLHYRKTLIFLDCWMHNKW